jgi:hypothetical protein
MTLKDLCHRVLATALAVIPLTVATNVTTACATTSGKQIKKDSSKKKEEKFKNYSLYRNRELNWKILRQGERERGGSALDSY